MYLFKTLDGGGMDWTDVAQIATCGGRL